MLPSNFESNSSLDGTEATAIIPLASQNVPSTTPALISRAGAFFANFDNTLAAHLFALKVATYHNGGGNRLQVKQIDDFE